MNDIEKAIEELKSFSNGNTYDTEYTDLEVFNLAIMALEEKLNGGWISAKERLPEQEFIDYLITTEKGKIYTSQFYGYGEECQGFKEFPEGVWEINECGVDVIAWQPLPEPWRGGTDE